jgi:hypothetical protein
MRRLPDGLFYLVRTGCQWRHLPPPPAFPPWRTVYEYLCARSRARGVWEAIRHRLVYVRGTWDFFNRYKDVLGYECYLNRRGEHGDHRTHPAEYNPRASAAYRRLWHS